MHTKETRLAAELKNGSTKALEEIIDSYSGYTVAVLHNFSRGMLTEEDIDELCSDVFFSLWQHRDNLDTNIGFRAYIAAISRNAVKNRLRNIAPFSEDIDNLEIADTVSVEERAELNEIMCCLDEAIGTLSEKQRMIFQRYFFYGEKTSEIAETFGLADSSVRCEISRIRTKLRNYLAKRGFDYV